MSKKRQQVELDKSERIKKHKRSHKDEHKSENNRLGRLEPKHKPAKKQHINLLDAYEKFGDEYEGFDD